MEPFGALAAFVLRAAWQLVGFWGPFSGSTLSLSLSLSFCQCVRKKEHLSRVLLERSQVFIPTSLSHFTTNHFMAPANLLMRLSAASFHCLLFALSQSRRELPPPRHSGGSFCSCTPYLRRVHRSQSSPFRSVPAVLACLLLRFLQSHPKIIVIFSSYGARKQLEPRHLPQSEGPRSPCLA